MADTIPTLREFINMHEPKREWRDVSTFGQGTIDDLILWATEVKSKERPDETIHVRCDYDGYIAAEGETREHHVDFIERMASEWLAEEERLKLVHERAEQKRKELYQQKDDFYEQSRSRRPSFDEWPRWFISEVEQLEQDLADGHIGHTEFNRCMEELEEELYDDRDDLRQP